MIHYLAAVLLAANVTSVQSARVSVDFLRRANAHTDARSAKGQARQHKGNQNAGGVPNVDSLVNFTSQFTAPGFDFNGNPQSVWPFEMVGQAPERGDKTVIPA